MTANAASCATPATFGTVTVGPRQVALACGDALTEVPDAASGDGARSGPGECAATSPTVTPIAATAAAASAGSRHDLADGRAD